MTEYYEKNKDKIKKKSLERYYKHRDGLCQKVTCDCGSILSAQNMKQHLKTGLHARRFRRALLKRFCIKHTFIVSKFALL